MKGSQLSRVRSSATRFGGPEGSSWHPAGTLASLLALRAVLALPEPGHRAPDTAPWSVVTAPPESQPRCRVPALVWLLRHPSGGL